MSKFDLNAGNQINLEQQDTGQKDRKGPTFVCSRCTANHESEPHTCPFAEEIGNDSETLCDCCDDCTNECAMDI